MSLLFSPIYKCEEGDQLRKNPEFMGSNFHHHHHHQQQQQQQQQQHQQPQQQISSSLARYRSAPSSLLESLVDGSSNGGSEDFPFLRSSSPEVEAILAKFMSSCNGSGESNSHDWHEFGGKSMKQEPINESVPEQNGSYSNGSQMVYQAPQAHDLQQENLVSVGTNNMESSFGSSMNSRVENSMQVQMGSGNCSNLIRQSSSPAGFFSNFNIENGFAEMRELGSYRACDGVKRETTPSTSRINNYMNFSTGTSSSSRLLPQINEMGNESMGISSPENRRMGNDNGNKRSYVPSFLDDSWQNSGFSGLKRAREDNGNMYSGLNSLENQNGNSGNRTTTLTHQFSLPNTSAEMAAIDKFLQFQGSVPCKIRAKRGFATHPRSIAERMRRTRISERMRKLQDLFPNMDKQTNTADMLDLAVEYIKDLQKHVKTLTDTKAKCTCPSKQKHYSDPCA